MNLLRKEPAAILAALVALVQAGAIFVTGDLEVDTSTWAVPLLSLLVGVLTRGRVFSEHTVREAGYTPAELVARANSPHIRTAEEE